jgi:hypothetical protein
MIRKAHDTDASPMDPTPEQIRQRSAAIRKTWSPRERARRSNFKHVIWTPPVFAEGDLPGYLIGDFEARS